MAGGAGQQTLPRAVVAGEGPVSRQGLASGAGNMMAQARQRFAQGQGMPSPTGGKGGGQAGQPQPQPMPTPQGGFNLQQAVPQALGQAMQVASRESGYQPLGVRPTGYAAPTIGAGQLASTSLSPYMNPYESQVVEQTLGDIERQRQMQQNVLGAQATQAGAFGGSRQGVAEAETNRAFAEQMARTAAGLRQAGFTQAQQAAQQDIATRLAAAQANQAAMQQARQFGATQGMTAQQLNQMAGLQGAQQRLAAGQQLGSLANLGFGMGQTINQQLAQQGMMQQALNQAIIDAARGQYAGFTGAPTTSLQQMLGAFGGSQTGQQTTTGTFNPGLYNYAQLGASMFRFGS